VRAARQLDLRPQLQHSFAPAPARPFAPLASPSYVMCNRKSQMTFGENIALKYHINMEQKPDISSSGAAKSEADPAYVNLKVKQQVLQLPFTPTDLKSYVIVQLLLRMAR
jgi:hypothetical protein